MNPILEHIDAEARTAQSEYGDFTSLHEALAVLEEEVAEFREWVHKSRINRFADSIAAELHQISAVAYRIAAQIDADPDWVNRR